MQASATFDFERAAPGMADMFRRLYTIRVDCGMQDSDAETKEEQDKKLAKQQMTAYEYKKYCLVQELRKLRTLVMDSDSDMNIAKKNQIRRMLRECKEALQTLQDAPKEQPTTATQKKQHEVHVLQHELEQITFMFRRSQLLGAENPKKLLPPSTSTDPTALENAQQDELATIDISEGLKQVQEQKDKQDQILEMIARQTMQMKELAVSYHDELKLQLKKLNKLDKDVEVYNAKLLGLNDQMHRTVASLGGEIRLICLVFGAFFVLLIALILMSVFFFVKV